MFLSWQFSQVRQAVAGWRCLFRLTDLHRWRVFLSFFGVVACMEECQFLFWRESHLFVCLCLRLWIWIGCFFSSCHFAVVQFLRVGS